MRIMLSPQRSDAQLVVGKSGDVLTINGDVLDLSALAAGDSITGASDLHPFLLRDIDRSIDGEIELTLRLPHGPTPEPYMAFPDTLEAVPDGPVDLPWDSYRVVESEKVEGGTNVITTTYRWHQEPEVSSEFIPDPPEPDPAEQEEA
ncbi:hypothetical protein [Devosia geojensis]|uniref:hypothetical protein n=1 Tax=Devosia geojensis TaxID=443610 RepID=UPI000695D30A|nr:hypothetical protein [Devosia geojensis]